ncbi:MAG: outer membrane beta-barrel protein [Verrucomicrobia bacterium]|nr:outer membrane beta-barrel protein [Verrucomicrobiota bacterium]MDA1067764.1 outer membrane beta-barrel protein [Verrucomicrobiota bacterium]
MAKKSFSFSVLAVLSFSTLCTYSSAVSMGENGNVAWRIGGGIQYNDNIFLDSIDAESDQIIIFSPGVELSYGQELSNANVKISYVHDFITYADNSRLNRDNPDAKLSGFYRSPKSVINYGAFYRENSQNDAGNNLVGDLAQRSVLHLDLGGEWDFSPKSSVSVAYKYDDVSYDNPRFFDRDSVVVPVNFYWAIAPKLDMSVGYQHRNTSFERGADFIAQNPGDPLNIRPDYDDQFINVGLRGSIGAKTTAEIRIGTQNRDFNVRGMSTEDLLSAYARVVWAATEKSEVSFVYSRDFNADSYGTSIKSDDLQISGSTELSKNWAGFASLRLSSDDYSLGRSDDGVSGQVGVTYAPNSNTAVSIAYIFYNNDSDFAPADFDNNVINISGTLRY